MEETDNRGVVYIGRIPPKMSPGHLKSLLARFAPVDRIYLEPFPNSKGKDQSFSEGWIEFLDKKDAKSAAVLLNGQPMAQGKKKYYSQDLWCLKYLSGFRWTHLTEKLSYERAIREQKLQTELSQSKRENSLFMRQVERGKMIDKIQKKKGKPAASAEESFEAIKRKFKQRKVIGAEKTKVELPKVAEKPQTNNDQ